jgi:hypothetical protein
MRLFLVALRREQSQGNESIRPIQESIIQNIESGDGFLESLHIAWESTLLLKGNSRLSMPAQYGAAMILDMIDQVERSQSYNTRMLIKLDKLLKSVISDPASASDII